MCSRGRSFQKLLVLLAHVCENGLVPDPSVHGSLVNRQSSVCRNLSVLMERPSGLAESHIYRVKT